MSGTLLERGIAEAIGRETSLVLEQFALPRGGDWAFALCLNGFERRAIAS